METDKNMEFHCQPQISNFCTTGTSIDSDNPLLDLAIITASQEPLLVPEDQMGGSSIGNA
jgi:hypothetical protein